MYLREGRRKRGSVLKLVKRGSAMYDQYSVSLTYETRDD